MDTLVEQSPEFSKVNDEARKCLKEIIKDWTPSSAITIARNERLYQDPDHRAKLFVLRDGKLTYSIGGRALFFFEENDLIGLEQILGSAEGEIYSDFAVVVEAFNAKEFFKYVAEDQTRLNLWQKYFGMRLNLLTLMLATLSHKELITQPEMKVFSTGSTIIEEGVEGDEVFTLLEGQADVLVKGVKVGEILADEIFGVLAALTKSKRTATVVAATDCMVLSLPAENFVQLVESRPATVNKMVQDMARTIVDLNKRVVGFALGKLS